MASWQAKLTNLLLRCLVKPGLRREERLERTRIEAVRRRGVWCARRLVRPLRGTDVRPVNEAGVRGEWLLPDGGREDRAVLFVHGGGFIIGSPGIYRHLASRLAHAAGCAVFSIDYPLAPEHPFPAALDNVVDALEWLERLGFEAPRLALAGDSAGGNLALAAVLRLKLDARAPPTALALMAPWTDLTMSGASVAANARADPYIPVNLLQPVARVYLQGSDPRGPEASPLFGAFEGLPPMLIHVGANEVLLDDSVRLERAARAAGVDAALKVWQGLPHVFQLFSPFLPEGRQSLKELGEFVRLRLTH